MELVALARELSQRRLLIAVMVALSVVAAIATAYKIPSMEKRTVSVGAATSQILVDSDPSTLVAGAGTDQIAALGSRARVYAQYLSSRDAVSKIASDTGIPARLITARGPFSQGTGISNYEQQPAESRARDLVDEEKGYRLVFEAQEDVPIITVYATGPTAETALKLAESSFATLDSYVQQLKERSKAAADGGERPVLPSPDSTGAVPINPDDVVVVRELGQPEGGTVGGGSDLVMMFMAFVAAFGVQVLIAALVIRLREQRWTQDEPDEALAPASFMTLATDPADLGDLTPGPRRSAGSRPKGPQSADAPTALRRG
jgi:hypothetical protein